MKKLYYTAICDVGLLMQENQDHLFCGADGRNGIFVIADGMGGHQNGAYASAVIIEKVKNWWEGYLHSVSVKGFSDTVEELKTVFSQANEEIYCKTERSSVCGSTLVALWMEGDRWAVFSCGDSRCYLARRGLLKRSFVQLTTDDVWENQHRNIFGMDRKQAEADKNYGCLVKAVGVKPELQCSIQCDQCIGSTLFLLCSDGVYKYCSEETLRELSFLTLGSKNLEYMASDIREQVFRNGAKDNLSYILVMAGNKPIGS